MTGRRLRISHLVHLVDCPFCGAGSGTPCRAKSGNVAVRKHQARVTATVQAVRQLCANLGYVQRKS